MKGREGGKLDSDGGEGSVEQNAKEKRGLEGCFLFMSWHIGAFEFV